MERQINRKVCPLYYPHNKNCSVVNLNPSKISDDRFEKFCSSKLENFKFCHLYIFENLTKSPFRVDSEMDRKFDSLKKITREQLVGLVMSLKASSFASCTNCQKKTYKIKGRDTHICFEHNVRLQKTIFLLQVVNKLCYQSLSYVFKPAEHGPLSPELSQYIIDRQQDLHDWLLNKSDISYHLGEDAFLILKSQIDRYFNMDLHELELLASKFFVAYSDENNWETKSVKLEFETEENTSDINKLRKDLSAKYQSSEDFNVDWKVLEAPLSDAFQAISEKKYHYEKLLGLGSSALVFLVKQDEQSVVQHMYKVVKFPRPSHGEFKLSNLNSISFEIEKLSKLKHSCVVSAFTIEEGSYQKKSENKLPWYMMDYIENSKDLSNFIDTKMKEYEETRKFNLRFMDLMKIIKDVSFGLDYLHHNNIIHLDVKPGNILVSVDPNGSYNGMISDLGYSVYSDTSEPAKEEEIKVRCDLEVAPPFLRKKIQGGSTPQAITYQIKRGEICKNIDLYELGKTIKIVYEKIKAKLGETTDFDHWITPYQIRYLDILIGRLLANSLFPIKPDQNYDQDFDEYSSHLYNITRKSAIELAYLNFEEVTNDLDKMLGCFSLDTLLPECSTHEYNVGKLLNIGDSQLMAPISPRVEKIIKHKKFADLAKVTQLGFVRQVYPGAVHTRYEHSIGVYSLSISYVKALWEDSLNPIFKSIMSMKDLELIVLSALLHDIGYYPMAHDFEDIKKTRPLENYSQGKRHEILGIDMIDTFTDFIKGDWHIEPEDLKKILGKQPVENNSFRTSIIRSIIDGPLDVDKLDYVFRDCQHCGLPYSNGIDRNQLIRNLSLEYRINYGTEHSGTQLKSQEGPFLAIKEKGRIAAEMLAFARYDMFSVAYWHHTVRTLKRMLSYVVSEISPSNLGKLNSFYTDYSSMEVEPIPKEKLSIGNSFSYMDMKALSLLYTLTSEKGRVMLEEMCNRNYYKRLWVYDKSENTEAYDLLDGQETGSIEREISELIKRELEDNIDNLKGVLKGLPIVLIDNPKLKTKADLFVVNEDDEETFRTYKSQVANLIYDKFFSSIAKIRILIPYELDGLLSSYQRNKIRNSINEYFRQNYHLEQRQ